MGNLHSTRGWTGGVFLAACGIALSLLLLIVSDARTTFAQVGWPTPPPAAQPPVPRLISQDGIRRVSVPLVPGATSSEIHPLAMQLPRFPPVLSFPFQASDGVRVISDAGSILTTLQLVYEPIPDLDDAPSPGPLQELRKVFDLRVYDHNANRTSPDLQRPWVLEVPVQGLTGALEDASRLVIARHVDGEGWMPLVTSYYIDRGILQARVLEVGLFAVVHEQKAITG